MDMFDDWGGCDEYVERTADVTRCSLCDDWIMWVDDVSYCDECGALICDRCLPSNRCADCGMACCGEHLVDVDWSGTPVCPTCVAQREPVYA